MDRQELTQALKAQARALGFDLVGVTDVTPFVAEGAAATARVAAGLFQGLPWFTAERVAFAADPRNHLPTARSLVALGIRYDAVVPQPQNPPEGPRGRIARYAWGEDYHRIIERKLKQLAAWLQAHAPEPATAKIFVDTGRLLDRAVARRAGLGWFGKNTNLLNRSLGSYLFLAELLTTVELEPDIPVRTHCGACTRCLTACPTGALIGPGVLDNDRCISFLTIELRGPIPRPLRPLIGTWIFGCDICQEVCPVNRRVSPTGAPEFAPNGTIEPAPALIPLLRLSEAEFRQRFAHSPIKRAKRDGFLRNVAVALGNAGDPTAIPALLAALDDVAPLVRGHAAWALGKLGHGEPAVQAALATRLAVEPDTWVREELRLAQERLDSIESAPDYTPPVVRS